MEDEVASQNVAPEASGEKRDKGKGLYVVLGVLCVAIVGLVVGIVVVNSQGDDMNMGQSETEYELPEELMGDDLSPTDQVIKETSIMLQDPSYNNEDIEAYYDAVVDGALVEGDTDLAMRIIIQKVGFLVVTEEDCAKAESYVRGLDLSPYSTAEQEYLASYIISMTTPCEGYDFGARWSELYNETEQK